MAKKKSVKKTRKAPRPKKSSPRGNKIKLVFTNFLFFVILAASSLILLKFVTNSLWLNLLQIMAMGFGFVAVGLLIALLVLLIMKSIKKSK
jgi:hypothetical protein